MLRWRLLILKWLFDKQHNPDSAIFHNPLQVFDASTIDLSFGDAICVGIDKHRLNRFDTSHPWVVQETAALPKIRPKIWFAYIVDRHPVPGPGIVIRMLSNVAPERG